MRRTRDPLLLAAALVLLCTGILVTREATQWVGKSFPGFLILENRVVASAGLAHWSGTQSGKIYRYEVTAVDGRPVRSSLGLLETVSGIAPGTPIRYEFAAGGDVFERTIDTHTFSWFDFSMLFGAYLFCGLSLGGLALAIRYMRGSDRTATGTAIPLFIVGMWSLTAMDLYGPYRLFRLHAFCESFLFAAMIHLAICFPDPFKWLDRHPRAVLVPYGVAAVLALIAQIGLMTPEVYVATQLFSIRAFGAGLAFLILCHGIRWVKNPSFETRQRLKVVALGCGAALGPQLVISVWAAMTGSKAPQNIMALTGIFFPISVGYAVMRQNVLGVDELVRRSMQYVLMTAVVFGTYVGCLTAFEVAFQGSEFRDSSSFMLALAGVSVFGLIPMRDRLQVWVDRAFFRTSYNFSRIIEDTSRRLASATELQVIYDELSKTVGEAVHPEWIALYFRRSNHRPLEAVAAANIPIPRLLMLLNDVEDSVLPVDGEEGCLAVPFRVEEDLRAVLLLGPRRSGRMYSGDDRRLLLTIANQGAVAIQNALAMEELRRINAKLEGRVDERTSELNHALAELQKKNTLLTRLSTTDSLTGLRNRAYLDEALATEFSRSRRLGTELTVLMVDLDHFKRVNDDYGHQAGDEVLRQVAELIRRNLRASDVAGRYGGEEFLIILSARSSGDGGLVFAERLRMGVEDMSCADAAGNQFCVTLSAGVSTLRADHRNIDALVSEADVALYRAKGLGRNRIVLTEEES